MPACYYMQPRRGHETSAICPDVFLIAPILIADDHDVDFDHQADFSKFKTFVLREGEITAKAPDLNSSLVRKKIDAAIRTQLSSKGLEEVPNQGDLVVTYRLGSVQRREVQSFPAGRLGRARRVETTRFTEGTLVIDLITRQPRDLVWRGIYRDDESNPSKISNKLSNDIKKLFEEYPPKKK
jgi:uncharacterized protein DUF4136